MTISNTDRTQRSGKTEPETDALYQSINPSVMLLVNQSIKISLQQVLRGDCCE